MLWCKWLFLTFPLGNSIETCCGAFSRVVIATQAKGVLHVPTDVNPGVMSVFGA